MLWYVPATCLVSVPRSIFIYTSFLSLPAFCNQDGLGVFNEYAGDNADARWGDYNNNAYAGTGFIRIQDNSGDGSSIYSDSFDVSAYELLMVSFYFKHIDFESTEEFVLEVNGGGSNIYSGWTQVESWEPIRSGGTVQYEEGTILFCQGKYRRILTQ